MCTCSSARVVRSDWSQTGCESFAVRYRGRNFHFSVSVLQTQQQTTTMKEDWSWTSDLVQWTWYYGVGLLKHQQWRSCCLPAVEWATSLDHPVLSTAAAAAVYKLFTAGHLVLMDNRRSFLVLRITTCHRHSRWVVTLFTGRLITRLAHPASLI